MNTFPTNVPDDGGDDNAPGPTALSVALAVGKELVLLALLLAAVAALAQGLVWLEGSG